MSEYELRLVTAGGVLDEYLPDYVEFTASTAFSDIGSVALEYLVSGLNYAVLDTEEREIALCRNGVEVPDGRYVLQDDDGDELDENGPSRRYVGRTAVWAYLEDGLVYSPDGSTSQAKQTTFSSATAGTIISTLLLRAQTRGACTLIDYSSFTSSLDSNGVAWSKVVNITYDPGVSILQVLQNLVDQGMCEVRCVGRQLRLYNPGSTAISPDLTIVAEPIILRAGVDITEAPRRRSSRGVANVVLIRGDNDVLRERTDAPSLAARRRRELFVSQGGVSDDGTLNVIADQMLSLRADPRVQKTYGLSQNSEAKDPWSDYNHGAYLWVDTGASPTVLEKLRVRQISVTCKAEGEDGPETPELAVVLNDVIAEKEIETARKVAGITGGATLGGGSTAVAAPTTTDRLAPAAPAAPVLSSAAYVDNDGKTLAQLTISWTAVTTNSDGTACTDLGGYEAQYARVAGQWVPLGRTDAATTIAYMSSLPIGKAVDARVRAYDTNGNSGAWSSLSTTTTASDATAPNTPSTPSVDGSAFLGTLRITWDGKDSGGAAMPLDFASLEVHASTVNNFTPSIAAGSSTKIDEFLNAVPSVTVFQGIIGTVTYVKFVAVDKSGNRSIVSAQGSGTARQGVDADLASLNVGKLTAGSLVADVTVSARIKTANSGARVELNSAGLQAFNSGGSQTVDVSSATGNVTIVGTIKTAFSGIRMEIGTATSNEMFFYSGHANETSPGRLIVNSGGWMQLKSPTLSTGLGTVANITLNSQDTEPGNHVSIDGHAVWLSPDPSTGSTFGSVLIDTGTTTSPSVAALHINIKGASASPMIRLSSYNVSPAVDYVIWADNVGSAGGNSRFWVDAIGTNGTCEIWMGPRAATTYLQVFGIKAQTLYLDGWTTTTASAANVFYNTTSKYYARVTSSLRYKDVEEIASEPRWEILNLDPFFYRSRSQADQDENGHSRRYLGLSAEDVDAVGLYELVEYSEDGEPDSLMYERLAPLLIPIVRDLKNRLEALESLS